MAINPNLTKPQLLNINSFDVSDGQTFEYLIGSQTTLSSWVGATLKIKNNETDETVYEEYKVAGLNRLYKFILEPDATGLENGVSYNAQISYRLENGDDSDWSNQIFFYCLTNANLIIENLNESQFEFNVVPSTGYEFIARYSQLEGEKLSSIVFNLYSSEHILISTSGDIYTSGMTYEHDDDLDIDYLDVPYTFNGFNDNYTYYIDVKGKTEHNMICVTEPSGAEPLYPNSYRFLVDYARPNVFAVLQLENDCLGGYINITSNIVDIEGKTLSGDDPTYIDDTKVDLRNDGVIWDNGYQITGDFTLSAWIQQLDYSKSNLIEMEASDNDKIIIKNMSSWIDDTEYTYIEVYIYNNDITYYIYSNTIEKPINTDTVFIWLRRINNVYDIKIENLGGDSNA